MAEGHTSPSGEPRQAGIAQGIHMIPLLANLNVRGNLASNWKKFRRMWNNYEIGSWLQQESKELRTATLLTCIGVEALETYEGLEWVNEDEKVDIDIVLEKLETFMLGPQMLSISDTILTDEYKNPVNRSKHMWLR